VELKPIRARSVSEAVYAQLRDAILTGQLAAGQLLPGERRLCETLEVNRGALREALKRLEQDQLVSVHQGEGTRVLDFRESARVDLLVRLIVTPSGEIDRRVAQNVAELRDVITPDIARRAAQRRGPDEIARLEKVLSQMQEQHGQMPAFQERVEEFWSIVAEASKNVAYKLLNNTMRELHLQCSHMLRPILGPEFVRMEGYRAIADAIVQGDPLAAASAARQHAAAISRSLGVDPFEN